MRNELTRRELFEKGIEMARKLPVVALLAACAPAPVRPAPPTAEAKSREQQAILENLLAGSIYFTTGPGFPSQGAFIKEEDKYYIYTNKATADKLKDNATKKLATIAVVPITTNGIQFEVDTSKFIYEDGKDGALYPMDPLRPSIDDAMKTDRLTYLVRSEAKLAVGDKVALPRPGDNSGKFYTLEVSQVESDGQYVFDYSFGEDCIFPAGACILKMNGNVVTKEIMGLSAGANVLISPATSQEPAICKGQITFRPVK